MAKKILIVDDDKFLLDMYSLKFSDSGYEVAFADSAAAALAKLDEGWLPDVFLIDIIMPEIDGFVLIDEIKKRGLAARAVVIILSNLGQAEDVRRGLAAGVDGYIIKASATPAEVIEKVSTIADSKLAAAV